MTNPDGEPAYAAQSTCHSPSIIYHLSFWRNCRFCGDHAALQLSLLLELNCAKIHDRIRDELKRRQTAMTQKNFLRLAMSALLLELWPASLFAQATFSVASAPTTAADIGLTELTGAITLSVVSGTTVAAPFRIDYSAPITHNSASEISVTGDGGLCG